MGCHNVKQVLLINVYGEDRPGVTNAVAEVLSRFEVTVLDIGQAVIHDQLNMGILVAVPEEGSVSGIKSEVLAVLQTLDMQGRFLVVSDESYHDWVDQQGKARHIVTLLARSIDASHLNAVTKVTADQGLNIDKIVRLSGRVPLEGD